jgi:hypothetical protein
VIIFPRKLLEKHHLEEWFGQQCTSSDSSSCSSLSSSFPFGFCFGCALPFGAAGFCVL